MRHVFVQLADECDLLLAEGYSPDGLPERYLYSRDMCYRYSFARWWGKQEASSTTAWVGLNPATGDTEARRRPTLERCIAWSRAWGSTGLLIVNLFAYRETDPAALKKTKSPVGQHNDHVLSVLTATCERTVVAWGAYGRLHGRSSKVAPVLSKPLCLGVTSKGEPRHPLYVSGSASLIPWQSR